MSRPSAEAELSVTRSRVRRQLVIALSSLGEAFPGQLARFTGFDRHVVSWALHGHPPRYRKELALVPLGLAVEVVTPNGRAYRITSRGQRKARSLTARWARRRSRRER